MQLTVRDLVKMPDKKFIECNGDHEDGICDHDFSCGIGYNQAIDEIGSLPVKIDREKLAKCIQESAKTKIKWEDLLRQSKWPYYKLSDHLISTQHEWIVNGIVKGVI